MFKKNRKEHRYFPLKNVHTLRLKKLINLILGMDITQERECQREYSTPQTEWVLNNEVQIWSHFLTEQLLYETSTDKIKKLVDQSPSSPGMPKEAPGRTGNFIGLRIVEAFMNRKPEVTMEQLIGLDAQKIFNESKYKPRTR